MVSVEPQESARRVPDVLPADAAILEYHFAGGRGAQPEFVLLFAHLETRKIAFDQEGRHTFVALFRTGVGKEQEEAGFGGISDPQFAARQ